jgi:hypothetical protein
MKVTEKQKQKIFSLRARNFSPGRIAQITDINVSTIRYHVIKMGCYKPRRDDRHRSYIRGGRMVRPFSEAEDADMLRRRTVGETVSAIARRQGRKHNSVLCRLYMLAAQQEAETSLNDNGNTIGGGVPNV